jgi:hypothetical protein
MGTASFKVGDWVLLHKRSEIDMYGCKEPWCLAHEAWFGHPVRVVAVERRLYPGADGKGVEVFVYAIDGSSVGDELGDRLIYAEESWIRGTTFAPQHAAPPEGSGLSIESEEHGAPTLVQLPPRSTPKEPEAFDATKSPGLHPPYLKSYERPVLEAPPLPPLTPEQVTEAMKEDLNQPGKKDDKGKPPVGMMFEYFPRALLSVAEVAGFGAGKYTRGGWISVPDGEHRYDDALGRHLLKRHIEGPDDLESHLKHLAHAAWNALAILELALRGEEE